MEGAFGRAVQQRLANQPVQQRQRDVRATSLPVLSCVLFYLPLALSFECLLAQVTPLGEILREEGMRVLVGEDLPQRSCASQSYPSLI
jgi:hypothetical protein